MMEDTNAQIKMKKFGEKKLTKRIIVAEKWRNGKLE